MKKGIWKPAGDFLITYNQLCPQVYKHCGAYACTLVSTVTSASNLTGIQLTDNQLGKLCEDFVATGKFNKGSGAWLKDAAPFALDWYNKATGQSLNGVMREFSQSSVYDALSSNCGAVLLTSTGNRYIADVQDNAVIDDPKGDYGTTGHALCVIKLNTMDDFLMKTLNSYRGCVYKDTGKPVNMVVLWKLPECSLLFKNSLYVISK